MGKDKESLVNMLARFARTATVSRATASILPSVFVRGWCSDDALMKGAVKWFDNKKGFGFIIPDDGSTDVFVHQSEIHAPGYRSLADGEEVEFRIQTEGDGRVRATDVTGPNGEYVQGAPKPESEWA